MPNALLAVAAAVCLLMALIESWLLVVVLSSETGPLAKAIPGSKDLLRSHIDYLMMAQFLFVFYGLLRLLAVTPSIWVVVAICFGSFCNPLAFLIRALKPAYLKAPPAIFTGFLTVSCLATTAGYVSVGWIVVSAALAVSNG